ncbi:hypothetical protein D3C77_643550 [compost metagenome]
MQRTAPACLARDRQTLGAQGLGQLLQPGLALIEQRAARMLQARAVEQAALQRGMMLAQQQLERGPGLAREPDRALQGRLGFLGGVDDDQQLVGVHSLSSTG